MERFTYDGKALNSTELEDGSMLLEGFALLFSGLDRESEQFAPGLSQANVQSFPGTLRTTVLSPP